MTDDIVKRLCGDLTGCNPQLIGADAADEIIRLRAENAKLRAALKFYDDDDNWRLNGPLDTNSGNFTGGPAKEVLGE